MIALDPRRLFRRLASEIPPALQKKMFVVGSLAAAYHFRDQLERRAVNTKDADIVVHPAGNVRACEKLARQLLELRWIRTPECYAAIEPAPTDTLRAIRLHPPLSRDYFIEVLGLPASGQTRSVVWAPIRMADGWYGVPCHRFMGLAALGRLKSQEGLEYAAPAMMALANLLSHPTIGPQRMSTPILGRPILRSAKDLGRVLALAWLSGRDVVQGWHEPWVRALVQRFPHHWRALARRAGSGLRDLLMDANALEEARVTTEVGLLNGRGVTTENLKAVGAQLQEDLLAPLARRAARRRAARREIV